MKALEMFAATVLFFVCIDSIVQTATSEYSLMSSIGTWGFILLTCGYYTYLFKCVERRRTATKQKQEKAHVSS